MEQLGEMPAGQLHLWQGSAGKSRERGTGRAEQRRERGGKRGAEAAKEKAKESESERAPRTERDMHTQERKERQEVIQRKREGGHTGGGKAGVRGGGE